jgi:hypothetical protein
MKIKSVLLKSLVMLLPLVSNLANAQKDSPWYVFAGAQHTLLNSFKSQSFLDGWPDISQNRGILSFEAGFVFKFNPESKNWSGLRVQISNTISNALSRSEYVSFREMGRTVSYISSDNLGLSMISVGYLYCRSFNSNVRSCFFLNPNIVFGTMKEKFIRDLNAVSQVKSTGYDLVSGVVWYPIREIGIKAFVGYRMIKMKIDIFEATGETVNWTGPYIGAGICLALPSKGSK